MALSIVFVGYWPYDEVTLRALLVMMLQGLCLVGLEVSGLIGICWFE